MTRSRRSVSSPLAGIRTFSGAPPGAASGMSCTWPSVMAIVPASRERGISANARSMAPNRWVPESPLSGTVTVRSSRSGSFAACWLIEARAASASRARSPTCIDAVWSTTSSPISGRFSRVSCTSRGPASHSSSTANAGESPDSAARPPDYGERHDKQREHTECGDQPERQQRIEAQCGDDFGRAHLS